MTNAVATGAARQVSVELTDERDPSKRIGHLEARLRILSDGMHAFAEATTDYERLVDTVAQRLAEVVGDSCVVFVASEDGRTLVPIAIHATRPDAGAQLRALLAATPLRLDEHEVARRVLETGEPYMVHSLLLVGMRAHGRAIGILTLARFEPSSPAFDEQDRQLAQCLADHAAIAIATSHLLRSTRRDVAARKTTDAANANVRAKGVADAAIRDSSARKISDELLRASEERYRLLVDGVKDYAVYMLDPDGRVMSWTAGAQRIKGYAADEIIGQHFSRFYTEADLRDGKPERELQIALAAGRYEEDGVRVRKDGSLFFANVVITPVMNGGGELVGFAKSTRDVTAQHVAADALKLANRELEAFSYSVAHDLRAPLRGMSGFARVLLDTYKDKLDAEGQDWLEEILLNAKKMGELIDALLSLARVTRSELKRETVDLTSVTRASASQLAAAEPARVVEIVIGDGLHAEADPRLLRALLDNLIGNAWKFTRDVASARIEVGVEVAEGARVFFVRDNGAGFDMAFAGKLFAPFQRLHTVSEFPGTGIGLATVQRIVHRHGGRIWADGRVDGGATFHFTLPGESSGGTT
jgi:PAS domain S-box-containing protein